MEILGVIISTLWTQNFKLNCGRRDGYLKHYQQLIKQYLLQRHCLGADVGAERRSVAAPSNKG